MEHAERFAERSLPGASQMDVEHSELVGRGEAFPEVAPEEGSAGAAAMESSSGAKTWRRRVAPRHRRAVRRFFDPTGAAGSDAPKARESLPPDASRDDR